MKNEETILPAMVGLNFVSAFCILPSSFSDYG